MGNNLPLFMIIDDDPINNHICTKYLQLVFQGAEVSAFTSPKAGLNHILTHFAGKNSKATVLLLDINMPVLTGWEVLEIFKNYPDYIKDQFSIYILSSSIADEDKNKAANNPLVSGFIEKPLTILQLQALFPQYAKTDLENI